MRIPFWDRRKKKRQSSIHKATRQHKFRRMLMERLEARYMRAIDVVDPLGTKDIGEDADPTIIDLRAVFGSDIDEPINFSVVSNSNTSLVTHSLHEWSLKLEYNGNGDDQAQILIAAQGAVSGWTATDTLHIDFNKINGIPTTSGSSSTVSLDQGGPEQTIDLRTVFDDEETADDDLTFSVVNIGGGTKTTAASASVDENGILTITPSKTTFGTTHFAVRATDEGGALVATTIFVDVSEVTPDTPPTSYEMPDRSFSGRYSYPKIAVDLWGYFHDAETPDKNLTFTVSVSDSTAFDMQPVVDPYGFLLYRPSSLVRY